jgi:hypothetical protein
MQLLVVCASLLLFLHHSQAADPNLNLVLVKDAVQSGAQCLDGSPPAYYIRRGLPTQWVVHFEGGGWCYNEDQCVDRSKTTLGSSKGYGPTMSVSGLFSNDPAVNPDFYNWTFVYLKYCDGASFSGDVAQPLVWKGTTLYFRGHRIFRALYNNLLTNGLSNATNLIVTGCSAGGLSTYLHLDEVRQIVPASINVRGLPDAGFFMDLPTFQGTPLIRPEYQYVARMQNVSYGVNSACINAKSPADQWQCFMAQYTLPFLRTPLFIMNPQYDSWQMGNVLALSSGCIQKPSTCSQQEMTAFQNFRTSMLQALTPALQSSTDGMWTDACVIHCQTLDQGGWTSIKVGGYSLQQTFGNWYFGRGHPKQNDCAWPCNPTC